MGTPVYREDEIVPERSAPIRSTVDALYGDLEQLDVRLNKLIERLGPILGPDTRTATPNGGVLSEKALQSELASRLDGLTVQIHRILRNVNDVHDRLEL
jgi:hypothetical protein